MGEENMGERKLRLCIICRGSHHFLNPLLKQWEQKYEIVNDIRTADTVWVEWANEQCILADEQASKKNVIVRVLGSEYYQEFWKACKHNHIYKWIIENPEYKDIAENTEFITEPIDTNFWKPIPEIQKEPGLLLMVGNFDYYKGQLNLLQTLVERPNYFKRILFVGEMRPKDVDRRITANKIIKQLVFYAKKHRLNLEFMDYQTPESLRELYNKADIAVSYSINEGSHTSIQEAMACGCKIIVRDWMGADGTFPGYVIVSTANDFWEKVDKYRTIDREDEKAGWKGEYFFNQALREYAECNFSYDALMPRINKIIESASSSILI
jgi:glycosyltransferase involved in cell wall biosynthesis